MESMVENELISVIMSMTKEQKKAFIDWWYKEGQYIETE